MIHDTCEHVLSNIKYVCSLLILFYRLKEFFKRPNFEPIELQESDVFQYCNSDEYGNDDVCIRSSCSFQPPTKKRCIWNSKLSPLQDSIVMSASSSLPEVSLCSSESDVSISPLSLPMAPFFALYCNKYPTFK